MNNSIQKFEEGEFESPEKNTQGGIPNGNGDEIKREENNNGLGELNSSTEAAEPAIKSASASSPEERKAAIKKAHDLLVSIGIGTGTPCEDCDDDYAPRPPITSDTYDAPDSPVKTKGGKSKVTHPNEHPKPVNKCGDGCDGTAVKPEKDEEDDSVVKGELHIPTWAELKKTSIATPALKDALTNGSSRTAAEMQLHDKERELGKDLSNMQEGGKEFADRQFNSMDPQQYQQAHDEAVENINTNPNAHPEVAYDNAKFKAYMDASSPVEDMNNMGQVENSVQASKANSLYDRVRALIRYQQAMTGPNKSLIARDEADRQMLSNLNRELYKSTEKRIPTWDEIRKAQVQTRLDSTIGDAGYTGTLGSAFELRDPELEDIHSAEDQIAQRERTLAAQPDSPTAQKYYNDTIGKLMAKLAAAKETRRNTVNSMAADPEKLAEAQARNKAVAGELDALNGQ